MFRQMTTLAMAVVALLGASVILGGCSTNPVTGKRELSLISTSHEISMGAEAAPEFEKEFEGRVPNPMLQSYVQAVGKRVAVVSDREMPYEFVLVRSKVPNAFALPGGKVFITAGLMSRMTNERQLAAVLGHEVGHVAAKHNVNGLQRQMGAAVLVQAVGMILSGTEGQAAQSVTKVVAGMTTMKYGRDDEYQADTLGIKYMSRAGYNPWGMVELLNLLKSLSESEGSALEEMFRTHPLTGKRISEAEETIEDEDEYDRFSRKDKDPNEKRFQGMHALLVRTVPGL
jgi:beta-barrel assembly-enhancing protease